MTSLSGDAPYSLLEAVCPRLDAVGSGYEKYERRSVYGIDGHPKMAIHAYRVI